MLIFLNSKHSAMIAKFRPVFKRKHYFGKKLVTAYSN